MFEFIDLFAGIGGFHIAMESVGGRCVFASEWDKFSRITYEANFKRKNPDLFKNGLFAGDITNPELLNIIPDFDVLCGGFPCQPFSNAGLKQGFQDTRGTLFFNIVEIVNHKIELNKINPNVRIPQVLLLENVKGFRNHDSGKTLKIILKVLDELGYRVKYEVLNAKNFGVPQNRERIFIVAWRREIPIEEFHFPYGIARNNHHIMDRNHLNQVKPTNVGAILEKEPEEKYTLSTRLYQGHVRRRVEHAAKGNGFGYSLFSENSSYTSTISARYYKDGSEILISQPGKNPRKITPKEAAQLQGFPKNFKIIVSDVQAYKQFGNAVAVPVVKAIALEIRKQLLDRR
jgi:DNA (cytosine-5)-methyltransferase 1